MGVSRRVVDGAAKKGLPTIRARRFDSHACLDYAECSFGTGMNFFRISRRSPLCKQLYVWDILRRPQAPSILASSLTH